MISILCLHVDTDQAAYRYRVEQFLPYWKEYGIDLHPVSITGKNYFEKLNLALQAKNFDYVWLQRKPMSQIFISIMAKRSRLVYDYDDALYARESYAVGPLKQIQPGSGQTVPRLNHILKHTSIVIAGSEALLDYAKQFNPGHTYLVPTSIEDPEHPQGAVKRDDRIVIGWIGGNMNLSYLALVDEATFAIQQKYPNVSFSLMCGKPAENLKTAWDFVPWSRETEQQWLESIDIGIMPLSDDEWSRGKCAFKLLQYMTHEKPVIASDVGANKTAVIQGKSGFLATSTREWTAAMETLITDRERRMQMGREGRALFKREFERHIVQDKIATILKNELKNGCAPGRTS